MTASHDIHIVVASAEIEIGVDLHGAELVEEVCDKWNWVLSDLEVSEVDTEPHGTILLGKEDRSSSWQLG